MKCRFHIVAMTRISDRVAPRGRVNVTLIAHLVVVLAIGSAAMSGGAASAAPSVATPFVSSTSAVTSTELGKTWRPGCPVAPAQLRLLHLSYEGFDGRSHVGAMVVNARVAKAVIRVFETLYRERFPIHSMIPESRFAGHDPASMAADNTSGFNCRYAVAPGSRQWSVHAFGEAIDVNPVQNPYRENGVAQPRSGTAYLNRSAVRPGMAVSGGVLVNAFASLGWYWGGRWIASPDYQHFSATGG